MKNFKLVSKNSVKPFWSWNDKLDKTLLCSQIKAMKEAGIDGFFMHARGGLNTEYMSDEWFEAIEVCLDEADKYDMEAWVYDENGWPSGFANGIVPSQSNDYCQKWIDIYCVSDLDNLPNNVLGYYLIEKENFYRIEKPVRDCYAIFINENKYYIDTFNKAAINCFIENVHEKYYKRFKNRFGKSLKGFFTDEPQYGNNGIIPWSNVFTDEFFTKYGYDLIDKLPLLFYSLPDYESFRSDYYNMVSFLFKDSFIKQVYDWCENHNCKLTGHMMNEESLERQMYSTAGVMSCYEYFHEPGIDWLGRKIGTPLVPKQLGSVAAQLNKKTLTETFALCGWDVSLNELKWIAQWQYANGVTSLCPHLEGYSIRGSRKRDYPASLFTQLPWFEKSNKYFCDYFSKLGGLLDSGKEYAPLLVLHMIQSAFIEYNPTDKSKFLEIEDSFEDTVVSLNANHIPHHYGDEILMEKYAFVENKAIKLGNCSYSAVLLPNIISITQSTLKLLMNFSENGGMIYYLNSPPKFVCGKKSKLLEELNKRMFKVSNFTELRNELNLIEMPRITKDGVECKEIECLIKQLPNGQKICYLINDSKENFIAELEFFSNKKISIIDIAKEEKHQCYTEFYIDKTIVNLPFYEYSSYVLLVEDNSYEEKKSIDTQKEYISLSNEQIIESVSANSLTLDKCQYRIDEGPWQKEIAVIKLQDLLLELKRACTVTMRFSFYVSDISVIKGLNICLENPERFKIIVNNTPIEYLDNGAYIDESIRRINIEKYTVIGCNTIDLKCNFYQSSKVYDVLFTPNIHEVEINKLTYDVELESIYLVGNFSVNMHNDYSFGANKAIFAGNKFSIDKIKEKVLIDNITSGGFWFFSGAINLKQNISIKKEADKRYYLRFSKLNAPSSEIYINSRKAGSIIFSPYELDVTDYLFDGNNTIVISLYSGNRNLLGPHHRPIGEPLEVGPLTFTDKIGWSDDPNLPAWTENYNFVNFGVEL